MQNNQPLKGLLVVALEQAVAAPLCTQRLADAGARVIKIERAAGETARHYDEAVHGTSAYFSWLNRGKESTVLDVKDSDDLSLIQTMLKKADIFVQNFSPGAMDRIGLSADILQNANPKLITLGIRGYGSDTSYADMRAYDLLIQAESGICSVTGTEDEACKVGVSVGDIATGMNAHAAVLEALIERSITGQGKDIEISLFDSLADWMNVPLLHFDYLQKDTPRKGLSHAIIAPYGPVGCKDGAIMIVIQNPAEWGRFCSKVLKKPEIETDEKYKTNPLRVENREALSAEIAPIFAALSRDEAIELLSSAELASAKISTIADISQHPALRRIEGETNGNAFSLAASPLNYQVESKPIPTLGQHTQQIRKEFGA